MARVLGMLNNIEQLKGMGGITMEPIEGMDGFETVSIGALGNMGIKPVVGFSDGWMVLASDADAVTKVMETKDGSGDTIVDSETFKSFKLPVRGPVMGVSYVNSGENTRAAAQGLKQVGALLPMMMGMAGGQGPDRDQMAKIQEVLALLPKLGQIIEKFDFYDKTLTVTQPGSKGSYKRHTVTLIKPPVQ